MEKRMQQSLTDIVAEVQAALINGSVMRRSLADL